MEGPVQSLTSRLPISKGVQMLRGSFLSHFVLIVMDFIYDNHCHPVTEWNRDVLSSVALQQYAETISSNESPLNNCFGFTDGMVRPRQDKTTQLYYICT